MRAFEPCTGILFGSLRIDDARFGVVNLFVIFKQSIVIVTSSTRSTIRSVCEDRFPNVSDQFIFCKNTDGGRAFVFARFKRPSIPIRRFRDTASQRTRWRLSNVTPDTGKEKNAVRSFKFASAGFCFRFRAGFFLLLQARFGGGFTRLFSLENPTRAQRQRQTATPEANSPIPSGRKVKEHKRNSVAATKKAIEDFFILIPLSKL